MRFMATSEDGERWGILMGVTKLTEIKLRQELPGEWLSTLGGCGYATPKKF